MSNLDEFRILSFVFFCSAITLNILLLLKMLGDQALVSMDIIV